MLRFLLFDLDDTILDFLLSEEEALAKTLLQFGIEPTEEVVSAYSRINKAQWKMLERGETTRELLKVRRFSLLFDELGLDCDAEVARVSYEQNLSQTCYFVPDALWLLDELFGKYRMFIVSNGITAVQNGRIAASGIAKYFEKIFLSEEIGEVKPQKEFFTRCFAEIPDFNPAEAIIIGDSLSSDIQGGINAGIKTCLFNYRNAPADPRITPDFETRDLREITRILEQ